METSCYWSVLHCFFFVILNSPEFVLETYKVVRHVITQRNTLKASFQELPLLNNIIRYMVDIPTLRLSFLHRSVDYPT